MKLTALAVLSVLLSLIGFYYQLTMLKTVVKKMEDFISQRVKGGFFDHRKQTAYKTRLLFKNVLWIYLCGECLQMWANRWVFLNKHIYLNDESLKIVIPNWAKVL
jgi:hypothetical protein